MRKGFDGLSGIVKSQMALNVLDGSVFIFLNRRHTHIKLLLWEGDGFSVYYKRLEMGTYVLPTGANGSAAMAMDVCQLRLILQGVSLKKVALRPRLQRSA